MRWPPARPGYGAWPRRWPLTRTCSADGAPPVAGRLAGELIARGPVTLTAPACARCGRAGMPLTRTPARGHVQAVRGTAGSRLPARTAARLSPLPAATPLASRICERCRRHDRGHRPCGICGKTASIIVRARGDSEPDVGARCYRMPEAVCSVCGKTRECNFASTSRPVCPSCSPRATACCARCGLDRPPTARWPEGPVCDPCYTAALRSRGPCARCGQIRRLVAPPGPGADTCADCAGIRRHPRLLRLRTRGQALRERPLRSVQPEPPDTRAAVRRAR